MEITADGQTGPITANGGPVKINGRTIAAEPGQVITVVEGEVLVDGEPATDAVLAPPGAYELAESEQEIELLLGTSGTPGTFLARFSNRGARLLELRCGNYFTSSELTAEQQLDPANWVTLLDGFDAAPGTALFVGAGTRGSSILESGGSLALRREGELAAGALDLDAALWKVEVLGESSEQASGTEPGGIARATGIRMRCAPGDGFVYEKIVRSIPGSFDLAVELRVENPAGGTMLGGPRSFRILPGGVVPPEVKDSYYVQPTAIAVGYGSKDKLKTAKEPRRDTRRESTGFLRAPAPLVFAGIHSKYFAVLLRPAGPEDSRTMETARWVHVPAAPLIAPELSGEGADEQASWLESQIVTEVGLVLDLPPPGEDRTFAYRLYAGPKDHETFLASNGLHDAVHESDLSWFSGIGRLLTKILHVLHSLVGNWGVAIILLTLLIRAILFPLNRRAQTAMARYQTKMKRVQPKLEEIKTKYEDDPQRLRQEQARIMQEEGAFPPLGGCLPIFLQMPIFFGLFSALRTSFELRQAPFVGWIDDLSQPDRLMDFGEAMPFESMRYLNLLPILMTVLWIWQQRTMPQPTDEQARKMQRIMLFMPLVMGVFLYNYASGLSLYMMTQSGLGIFEQKFIKKHWPVDDTEPEKKKGGCAPFSEKLAAMAEEQQKQREALAKSSRGSKKRK